MVMIEKKYMVNLRQFSKAPCYCLLYDEIWFLTRKICPHNMEDLDFVHFVDEDLLTACLPQDFFKNNNESPFGRFPWDNWKSSIVDTIGLRWNFDNHSRNLKFGELILLPTPGNYQNLLVDRYIATTFEMDLAENSANTIWSKKVNELQLKLTVSEKLFTSSISSLQTIDGPWHSEIANLRSDTLLKKYRKKIQEVSVDDLAEVDKRVGELSTEFEKITSKLIKEHYETTGLFKTVAMFLLGFIPVAGNIIGGAGVLKEIHDKIKDRQESGWVGFLGKAKQAIPEE